MKRKLLLALWLLLPVALLAYHFGPGRDGLARDRGSERLQAARQAEAAENWSTALKAYEEALALVPKEDFETRARIRLAQANARIYTGELPEAMQDLDGLLEDVLKDRGEGLLAGEVREALASSQYHAAWLMRLEGADRSEWTVQTDQARQNFRLLAEQSATAGSVRTADLQKNLEATIRLAQMDLSELQGLPLPKKCSGCKNCSQKCRAQRESKQRTEKKEPKDARGAGQNARPASGGS